MRHQAKDIFFSICNTGDALNASIHIVFVFEEDLYGGQKGKTVQGGDPELAAELAKPAVAPGVNVYAGICPA